MSPIRDNMPLYCSVLKEALTSDIAGILQVSSIAPKTILAILEADEAFCYWMDREFSPVSSSVEGWDEFIEKCRMYPKEKLCSVQEFIPNAKSLFEAQQESAPLFDQTQFEDTNILIWTTYDTDAHAGNILAHVLREDATGHAVYGLKKIDNGLNFPEKNRDLRNALIYLPNANSPLSLEGKAKIEAIDEEMIVEKMRSYGINSAIPAFYERMSLLKELARIEGITLYEINRKMTNLEYGYETTDTFDSTCYAWE